MDDVLIVGAGLAGTSTAWHLAGTRSVRLLDQADQIGTEATAQNAGMQRRLAHDRVERQLACRAGEWLASPPPAFAEGIRRTGGILLLEDDPTAFDDAVADLRSRGVQVDDVSGAIPLPTLRGARHSRAFHVPDEALLDAHHLNAAFFSGARAQGARLDLGVRVVGLLQHAGRVTGVQTSTGPVHADTVVLATGAWSSALARAHGLDRPLVPLARHLLHTAPHGLSRADHPWMWFDDAGVYARPEGGGWLVSPCDEAHVEPRPEPGSAGPVDPLYRALAAAKLAVHLPTLADVRFVGGWTGLRTFTPDRRPLLGPDPELEGLVWATGLGGFGVTCSFAAGEAVAGFLTGAPPTWLDLPAVAPGRSFSHTLEPARSDLERYAG
ncbi:MAG: FAD-binding oxidoreductase [Myxococcota bacterium]